MREAEAKPGQVDPVSDEPKGGRGNKEFASSTAEVTGKSKETINRAIRRATEVCEEARDLIRGTASTSRASQRDGGNFGGTFQRRCTQAALLRAL